MTRLADAADALSGWLDAAALPLWSSTGLDRRGGSFEALSPEGVPLVDRMKRFRVHPRQAYAFAHAAILGWQGQARAASDHAFAFALGPGTGHCPPGAGAGFDGFVHLLTPGGEVADPSRDTYDHAFVLLACAFRIEAFGDTLAREIADETLRFLGRLRCADGSYLEGRPGALPRRQNPHMHLFEAFMALARATKEERWLQWAADIRALFGTHFWDGEVLREFFGQDWSLDARRGDVVEPGHMAEWCWLLGQWQALSGGSEEDTMKALLGSAERVGLDPSSGFLIDEAFADGRPSRRTRRLWVQCEYAKAYLSLARFGDQRAADKAAGLIAAILGSYLATEPAGLWHDQYDENGNIVSKDVPASTFYHLVSLAAEAVGAARAAGPIHATA